MSSVVEVFVFENNEIISGRAFSFDRACSTISGLEIEIALIIHELYEEIEDRVVH